jgi:Fic family protein
LLRPLDFEKCSINRRPPRLSEVHPFVDGNGRMARIVMNAELVAGKQERIIIPAAYRTGYLGALKAFSHNATTTPLIRMLDYAQGYTHP